MFQNKPPVTLVKLLPVKALTVVTNPTTVSSFASGAPQPTPLASEAPQSTSLASEAAQSTPLASKAPPSTPLPSKAPQSTPLASEAPQSTPLASDAPQSIPLASAAPQSASSSTKGLRKLLPRGNIPPPPDPLSLETPVLSPQRKLARDGSGRFKRKGANNCGRAQYFEGPIRFTQEVEPRRALALDSAEDTHLKPIESSVLKNPERYV